VTVPNFVGKQIAAATDEAENLGIALAPSTVESTEPAGTILSQDPAAGEEIAAEGEVKVTVAQARGTVAVPDLRLGSEVDAITKLFAAGLTRGIKTEAYDPVVPVDLIISRIRHSARPSARHAGRLHRPLGPNRRRRLPQRRRLNRPQADP
jgi:serine/threonine-protein kinase